MGNKYNTALLKQNYFQTFTMFHLELRIEQMSVQVEVKKLRLPAAGVAEKCDKTLLLRRCPLQLGNFKILKILMISQLLLAPKIET